MLGRSLRKVRLLQLKTKYMPAVKDSQIRLDETFFHSGCCFLYRTKTVAEIEFVKKWGVSFELERKRECLEIMLR